MDKICLKAPQSYSASARTYNFSIWLWEYAKTLMFMNSRFLDVSFRPKTNISYLWRRQDTQNNIRRNANHVVEISFV